MPTFPERDFGQGIDQLSAEDQVAQGFVEELLNVDPTSNGYLRKRHGYLPVGGPLPLKAKSLTVNGITYTAIFDSSIDFGNIPLGSRLLLVGRTSYEANPANAGDIKYDADSTILTTNYLAINNAIAWSGTSATITDVAPDIALWGVEPAVVLEKEAWVNSLGIYRASAEAYPVAALFGNQMMLTPAADLNATTYKLTTDVATIGITTTGVVIVGPAFATAISAFRTRGYVAGSNVSSSGLTEIKSISWTAGNTQKVVLQFVGLTASAAPVEAGDKLRIQGTGYSRNTGEFLISSVDFAPAGTTDEVHIWVTNPEVDSSDWDETLCGQAGVFTDVLPVAATSAYDLTLLSGDYCDISDMDDEIWYHYANGGGKVRLSNVLTQTTVNSGVLQFSRPSTTFFPISSGIGANSSYVRGAAVYIDEMTDIRQTVIAETGRSVTWDGTYALLATTNTGRFEVGDYVLVLTTGSYDDSICGYFEIVDIDAGTSLSLDTGVAFTGIKTVSYMAGVRLGHAQSNLTGGVALSFGPRWIPLRLPEYENLSTQSVPDKYFKQAAQQFTTSEYLNPSVQKTTSIQSRNFLTQEIDRTWVYDGVSRKVAGIQKWQAIQHIAVDYDTIAKIDLPAYRKIAVTSPATAASPRSEYVTVGVADYDAIPVGTLCEITGSSFTTATSATLLRKYTNGTTYYWYFDTIGIGGATAVRQSPDTVYKYYIRVQGFDTNGNVTFSAASGADDNAVTLTASAQVTLRFLAYPTDAPLDFDRMTYQIYRTKANGVIFYRVYQTTVDLRPFHTSSVYQNYPEVLRSYMQFKDTVSDDELTDSLLDAEFSAVKGVELLLNADVPSAKFCASAGDRLVLGNIRSPHQMRVTFEPLSGFTPGFVNLPKFSLYTTPTTPNPNTRLDFVPCSTASAITAIAQVTNNKELVQVTSATHGLVEGNWVYLTRTTRMSGVEGFATGDVDLGSDDIDLVAGLPTGLPVRFVGASLPVPFLEDTIYYLLPGTSATKYKFAQTPTGTPFNITVTGSGSVVYDIAPNTRLAGWYQVTSVVDANNFRVASSLDLTGLVATTWQSFSDVDKLVKSGINDTYSVPVFISSTVDDICWGQDNGQYELGVYSFQSVYLRRIVAACNAAAVACNYVDGSARFIPWLRAYYGNDVTDGNTLLFQSDSGFFIGSNVLEPTQYKIFVDGVSVGTSTFILPSSRSVFPSRLVASYPNYPEVFDTPYSAVPSQSDSAIDVGAEDGTEITGLAPFFGDSAFGGAALDATLVVFKTNKIMLVDVAGKQIQQIETQGLGCTYPNSIRHIGSGIIFANESGIYKLTKQLQVVYIGKFTDRQWLAAVSTNVDTTFVSGLNLPLERKYVISFPEGTSFTYGQLREEQAPLGSWTKYSNYTFCDAVTNEGITYLASNDGNVYSSASVDYNDNGAAIEGSILLRAQDFGDSGQHKRVNSFLLHFRNNANVEGTIVQCSLDMSYDFRDCDTFELVNGASEYDKLSDTWLYKTSTLRFSPPAKKCNYFQVKLQNSSLDEPLELTAADYVVEGEGKVQGIAEAIDRRS